MEAAMKRRKNTATPRTPGITFVFVSAFIFCLPRQMHVIHGGGLIRRICNGPFHDLSHPEYYEQQHEYDEAYLPEIAVKEIEELSLVKQNE